MTFEELLAEFEGSEHVELKRVAKSIADRVRAISQSERDLLVRTAIAQNRRASKSPVSGWDPQRTLVGIILHTAEVPRVAASREEQQLRQEIHESLKGLNGDPQAYARLGWIAPEDVLDSGTWNDPEAPGEEAV